SAIAARVSAFGTFSSSGNAWSAAMRWNSKRTASEAERPIASSAAVAFAFTSLSMRTCSIELCARIAILRVSNARHGSGFVRCQAEPRAVPRWRDRPEATELYQVGFYNISILHRNAESPYSVDKFARTDI